MKLCVSFGKIQFDDLISELQKEEFAEVRLDLNEFSLSQIKTIFSQKTQLIATFRGNHQQKKISLLEAINAGANFVDIDISDNAEFINEMKKMCKKCGCKLLLSYHNLDETPTNLEPIFHEMEIFDPDFYKIVTHINEKKDILRLFNLYQNSNDNLIIFGLGKRGSFSRVTSLFLGAPFTYTFLKKYSPTAEGQIEKSDFQNILEKF